MFLTAMSHLLAPRGGPLFPAVASWRAANERLSLPPIVLGGGVFGYDYNSADDLESDIPEQTLRLAFRYGITTVDTSPYYTTSEAVLGRAFEAVADEFPRSTYQIITKAGRYGRSREDGFDYSPERIRRSIARSLELMKTDYLDGVYMHDAEFVAELVGDAAEGGYTVGPDGEVREEDLARWGLASGDEGNIRGPGDQKVLDAMATLFELKKEGVIRAVGFSGFPLPSLLRISRLVAAHHEPIDILQTYCHHTIQNTTLTSFLPLFHAAGVKQVVSASPLSMGLLRTAGGQTWHPASPALKKATEDAVAAVAKRGSTLEMVSLGYGFTSAALHEGSGEDTPTVVGLSTPQEVHETVEVYRSLYEKESRKGRRPGEGEGSDAKYLAQLELEKIVVDFYKESNTYNWTWPQGV